MFLGNRASIYFNLPNTIVQEIQGIPTVVNPNQKDILVWAFSKDECFSLNSAYLLAKGSNLLNLETTLHQWVWKSSTTPRIKFFLWLCVHCNIPTREVLGSRVFNLNITCELCGSTSETILHTLRVCVSAKSIWNDLGIEESNMELFNLPLADWLEKYCGSTEFFPRPCIPWKVLFP